MASVSKPYLTPQQYLTQERKAESKSQYFQGEIFAIAGGSRKHNLIVANIVREVCNALKDRRCEVYPSDMRVKVAKSGLHTYPDATVVCDEPEFEDDQFDTLTNPTVLFEVLSASTESYDRGGKFRQYREIDSLKGSSRSKSRFRYRNSIAIFVLKARRLNMKRQLRASSLSMG